MAFNGSGVYSLPATSVSPAVSGTLIESAEMNTLTADIATALSTCIAKDGQTTVTGNLPMATFRHTGVGDAAALTDYTSANQVVDGALLYAGASSAGTDTYAASLAVSPGTLVDGAVYSFKADVANTGACTINFNSIGATSIKLQNGNDPYDNAITVDQRVFVEYDGTNFILLNPNNVSAHGPDVLSNIAYTATVATAALTFALKAQDLTDPTTSDIVSVAFRSETLTTGDYDVVSATAATSVVVPSGGTLGFGAAATGYVYLYALSNSGTLELAVSSDILDESVLHTTVAVGVGSDSATALYSTTQRTDVPIRRIGKIKIATGAVAGEWDNAPTELYVGNEILSPSVSGYVKGVTGFLESDTGASAILDVDAAWAATTWESVGPTGAGADNTWSVLDDIPDNAKWVNLKVLMDVSHSSAVTVTLNLYGRVTGSATAVSTTTEKARTQSNVGGNTGNSLQAQGITDIRVPIDTLNRFDLHYTVSSGATATITIQLMGWDM